jgi:hypothetical protein
MSHRMMIRPHGLPAGQGRHNGFALAAFACALFSSLHVKAQSLDPFVRPPPGQQQAPITPQAPRPPVPPQQNTPPQGVVPNLPGFSAAPSANTMENLAKQGFEVKGLVRASERALDFMVIMQRGGEVRTCLLRVTREGAARPKQESVCF